MLAAIGGRVAGNSDKLRTLSFHSRTTVVPVGYAKAQKRESKRVEYD
jgi:hypothetical protein